MRNVLRKLTGNKYPDHAGLAHDVWAPLKGSGNEDKKESPERQAWFRHMVELAAPPDYRTAFQRWLASLKATGARLFPVKAQSRVLIGHGNPAATEVGITLHRTWGVPVIPGSALKGLASAYVQATYGPGPDGAEPEREPFRGVGWEGRRIVEGPGEVYRRIFGAPAVDDSDAPAQRGEVIFHDALWVPLPHGKPLGRDVLTVHHREYYEGKAAPNDHDKPVPVSFLTVRPGSIFLIALSAPDAELVARAEDYVKSALEAWGVGAKTAAGYGRLHCVDDDPAWREIAKQCRAQELSELERLLDEGRQGREQKDLLAEAERRLLPGLRRLPRDERDEAARMLRRAIKSRKQKDTLEALVSRLLEG